MRKKLLGILLFLVLCCVPFQAQEKGARVSVLGDSYSTFEGYMTPESNELWYYVRNGQKTDVSDVRQTWWWMLIKEMGWKLECNNSYSGATIGYQGYDGNDYSPRSFLTRMSRLGSPDVIFIFGATNDSWAGEPVGEYKWGDWTFGDFYTFRPAMACLLERVQLRYPNVTVYVLLNDGLRDEISESVTTIAAHYGVPCIRLRDIDKQNGHPSVKGMRQIADQIKAFIQKQ